MLLNDTVWICSYAAGELLRHIGEKQQHGRTAPLKMGDEFIEAQFDHFAVFHGDGLLAPFTGAVTEFAEDLPGLVQPQNEFAPILGQRGQLHQPLAEKEDALCGIAKPIHQLALHCRPPGPVH